MPHHPARHLQTQTSESAGDEVGAVPPQHDTGSFRNRAAFKAGGEKAAGTHGDLILTAGRLQVAPEGIGALRRRSRRIQVNQPAP
jgi:hypothetical protein